MKKFLAIILTVILAVSATACEGSSGKQSPQKTGGDAPSQDGSKLEKPDSPYKYSMASGSVGGNFYLVGGGIAQELNKKLPEYFNFTSETTGGGSANLSMLQKGDAELGIAMASSLHEATNGLREWTGGLKHDKLRVVCSLYPSWLTIYTMKDSGIKSFSDLEGRIVGLGSKGMAMDGNFREMFKDLNITPKQIHNDGHAATATAMENGVIDAAILFSYPPFAAISQLESTKDLNFIPLTEEEREYMVTHFTVYTKDAMPGGVYKGAPNDVPGVSEWNLLVSSKDVPEDLIYLITKTLFENNDDLVLIHKSLKYCTAKDTVNSNIYLHAGTIRCLKEMGVDVPDRLIPPEYSE